MSRITIRNLTLAALLLVILAIIMITRGRSPFGSRESQFSTGDVREITKIEFSGNRKKLTLEKRNDGWVVNGIHEARKSGISFILRILTEIKIKSPLSPGLFRSEITAKNIAPIRVRVFSGSRLTRSFLVYKTGSNIYGNVMKRREGAKAFIVNVPGFDGDIGSAFTTDELFWEPYTVFNLLPSEIESVGLENFTDQSASFTITTSLNKYTLCSANGVAGKFDTAQVRRYLSYFTWIPFEKWAFDLSAAEKNKILSTAPAARITIKKSQGGEIVLTIWEKINNDGSKDSDRLWAKTGDRNDLFVMRYFDIDPVLKKRSYFLPR